MTRAAPGRNRGEWVAAAVLPVARVAVDVPLAHLDRPFDYRVPQHLDATAVAGVRIRVRFAGRLVDGFVLERAAESEHAGRLAWVEKVVSPEPALTPEIAALARAVADRYAGVLADVLRLALPPRHARVEKEAPREPVVAGECTVDPAGWARYPRGPAYLAALEAGRAAHAVWQALPGESWVQRLAEAAAVTARAGRGALLVVPDARDVAALHAACTAVLGEGAVVALTADVGPAERYRRWLAVRRGQVRVVVGTRAAAFAPVADPGLLAVWDDGDDLHAEPRAPYPHVRDVLVLRAHQAGAALLVAGFARTAEGQLLVESGWASAIVADRAAVRAAMPRVAAPAETEAALARDPQARAARLPNSAFEAARAALAAGRPVLVQVPRAGYVPWLACARCRETARCRHCAGPLGLPHRAARAAGAHGRPGPGGTGGTDRPGPARSAEGVRADARVWPGDAGQDGHAARDGGVWRGGAGREGGVRPGDAGRDGDRGRADDRGRAGDGGRAGDRGRAGDGGRRVAASSVGGGAAGDDGVAALPRCRWCGRAEAAFRCGACGSRRLRAGVIGSDRTAEELGRAFPGMPVRASGGGAAVLDEAGDGPAIVVATPGAEPRGRYGAALLLDGWALLGRPDLRVAEETLRRWLAAAAMVVPHGEGGRVVVMADAALPPVQALVRWDPAGHAALELAARTEVGFPPAVRMAAVEGTPAALAEVLDGLPPDVEVLGPVEIEDGPGDGDTAPRERALVRVPRAEGRRLAGLLHAAQAARTARKAAEPVRVRLDPPEIG